MSDARRNESELLFEEYLKAHNYADWTHEVPVEGKRRMPDYRLEHGGYSKFFEVKEFDAPLPLPGVGTYDPYGPIREKINQAARQFKEYHWCPVRSRIESVDYRHRTDCSWGPMLEAPVIWAFSRKA